MTIHVALPAMNELEYIEKTLECLKNQSFKGFHTWVLVNQPESYFHDSNKKHICENNRQTLELLKNYPLPDLHIIDRSTPGNGWADGKHGVGYARKTLMDAINAVAPPDDIILSMDADTVFGERYLESVYELFRTNTHALALANPYYHPLVNDPVVDRAILRYEIYMRYYALNLRLTGTPYCFSPLGSAMAATVKAFRKINGMTPKKSGEDFYFLQKLAKAGVVMMYNEEVVIPGTRLSDRVFFGTGPAMIRGISGHWTSYPLFNLPLFAQVKETIGLFPKLFHESIATPMDDFLKSQFGCEDVFAPLRQNCKDQQRFIRACHEKIDGLRILQFLKLNHAINPCKDEANLHEFILLNFPANNLQNILQNLDFDITDVESINKIRNFLFDNELKVQKADAEKTGIKI
jgi:hypothetical protein